MVAMIPFVVGEISDPANLPTNTTATYKGEAYATIFKTGLDLAPENIVGTMEATANLDQFNSSIDTLKLDFGTVAGGALDMEMTGQANVPTGQATFQQDLQGGANTNPANLYGEVNGALFGTGADAGEEIGGNYVFERQGAGDDITGGGIFFGKQP
jgi:hypothetical protein